VGEVASRFAAAFQLLTAIPLFATRELGPRDLARSMGAFPLVGLVLGALLLAAHRLVGFRLPAPLEGALLAGLLAWSTGVLHLDGLADTADGLAGGWTREHALEIMKDSRTGAAGAGAVCLVLLAKAMGMGLLPEGTKDLGLLLTPAVARGSVVWLTFRSTYARAVPGLGTPYTEHLDRGTVGLAVLWAGLPCLLLGWAGLAAFGITLGYGRWLRGFAHRRFGGITGDVMGFAVETGEVLFLVALHALG
jgi:adenosylcobinamide-GDP ribazoletransferase